MKKRIYIYESGTLSRQDNSIVFLSNKGKKSYIPIYQIECIMIFGHCVFNKDLVQLLFMNNISILMFTFNGKYIGSYKPVHDKLGKVVLKQVQYVHDINKRSTYAIEIILSSIKNMSSVLKYYNKKGIDLTNNICQLEEIGRRIKKERNLTIFEARAKQIYYSSFNQIIKNNDFIFEKRVVNPPKDYINAIMSYGYALLYGVIESDIYKSNLCISLPFVHGISRKHDGLQYDIADIFKPVLIDRLIFRLINKKQITKDDFDKTKECVLLNKKGIKKFINEFEEELHSTVKVNSKQKMSYRKLLLREVQKIEKSISEDIKYKGYLMRW